MDLISPCCLYGVCPPFLGAFAKLRKANVSFIMSVRPAVCLRAATQLSLDGFSCNAIFEDFWKICRDLSSFIEICQE